MNKKTYTEKAKELCDNFWNEYQMTCDISKVDSVIKTYIKKIKSLGKLCDKEIKRLTTK